MNENELRIGNMVLFNGKIITVESIYDGKINVYAGYNGDDPHIHGLDCSNVEPVPLSPEILEAFGFIEGRGDYDSSAIVYINSIRLYQHEVGEYSLYAYNDHKVYVSNLHELMNLYYSLTGEALTVNLDKVKV